MMEDWIEQLKPIIDEYKDGNDMPLSPDEVERLALIIRFKIDVNQGNVSVEEMQQALDEHSYLSTLH